MRIRLVSVAVCLARQVAPQVGLRWVAQTLAGLIPSVYPQFSPQLRLLWSITFILITVNTYITLTICLAIHIQACRPPLHQIEALTKNHQMNGYLGSFLALLSLQSFCQSFFPLGPSRLPISLVAVPGKHLQRAPTDNFYLQEGSCQKICQTIERRANLGG